jgi:ADP-heptose:LPS heptosyltransferase
MKSRADELNRDDFRKSSNYYLAMASELAGPALRAISRLSCGLPTPRESWRKGLIISHTHIGDVLYRTPSLPHLAAALPKCEWHYLASPESAPVLLENPAVAKALPFVRGEDSWSLDTGAFAKLKKERYDVALCSNSLRHYPDFALAVALGIPNRVGYAHRGLSAVLTHPIAVEHPAPFPAYFREMVAQLCQVEPDWPLTPRLTISAADRAEAEEFLAGFARDNTALVACCPFSRQPVGRWPESFFVDTMNLLAKATPIRVLLCGSAPERSSLERCAATLTPPTRILGGELKLAAFAALLLKCHVVLSQDSAPRHLGNAAGTPVVFLRNLAAVPEESGVYCETETDAAPPGRVTNESELAALQVTLSPAAVAEKLLGILRR